MGAVAVGRGLWWWLACPLFSDPSKGQHFGSSCLPHSQQLVKSISFGNILFFLVNFFVTSNFVAFIVFVDNRFFSFLLQGRSSFWQWNACNEDELNSYTLVLCLTNGSNISTFCIQLWICDLWTGHCLCWLLCVREKVFYHSYLQLICCGLWYAKSKENKIIGSWSGFL